MAEGAAQSNGTAATVVTPTTSNGVKPGTVVIPTEVKAPAQAAAPTAEQLLAREQALATRERNFRAELDKNKREKGGLSQKLARLEELEKQYPELEKTSGEYTKLKSIARLNPLKAAQELWGEKAYELLMEAKANGVPPASMIQEEIQKLREDFEAKLAAKDKQVADSKTQAQAQEEKDARVAVWRDSVKFYEANKADYPIFSQLGDEKAVGKQLTRLIENHYNATGKLLSEKEAADGLESSLLAIAESAVGADKYKPRLTAKGKPAIVTNSSTQIRSTSSGSQGSPSNGVRRTNLETTSAAADSATDVSTQEEDRVARAAAAYQRILDSRNK